MQRTLSELPYKLNALEPVVGELTLDIHHGQHQRGYLEQLVRLVDGKPAARHSLEELICTGTGAIHDFAAQVWNHDFYWRSLKPGRSRPRGQLLAQIEGCFGSVSDLQQRLAHAANAHFASGWAWLVSDGQARLRVVATRDAGNPLREGATPLLAIDLWEHAYYLDYLSERERYVSNVIAHLLDWDFAAENLRLASSDAARGRGPSSE